jgi:hypothetical protein
MSAASEAYASAALRHLDSAWLLLDHHPDQSWHLAGYAPECAAKSALSVDDAWGRTLGHDLQPEALDWVLSLAPRAAEHRPPTPPQHWRPDCRYMTSGTWDRHQAHQLLEDCQQKALRTLTHMWVEGSLSGGLNAAL